MSKGELIISGVIFGGSLFLFFEARKFEGHDIYAKLGPAYWPEFLLVCLMILSLLIGVDALRARKKRDSNRKEGLTFHTGSFRLMVAIALIVLYFFLLKVVGFIALTPFFLVAFMLLLGERKKGWMIGVSLGMTALIIYVFTKAMYVPLPRGTGIFLKLSHLFY